MKNLSSLIERFAKSLNRGQIQREYISEVVRDKTRVNLPTDKIFLKEGVLEIIASPAAKNEIRLKEQVVLDTLKELHNIKIGRILYK